MITPLNTERPTTVLVSSTMHPEFIRSVRAAGPLVEVVPVENAGPLPPQVGSAQVLHRSIGFRSERVLEILDAANDLEWVHLPFAGVDGLLPPVLAERKIAVTHASGIYDGPVAEFALAQILSIAKRLPYFADAQREGRWTGVRSWDDASGSGYVPTMVRGKTVGILGFGGIGRTLASYLQPLGTRVLGFRRSGAPDARAARMYGPDGLLELLAASDFVVLALPLTAETREIIGATELAAMKPSAWLLNLGRGALVDDGALVNAVKQRQIGGACLDVFNQEPLAAEHPYFQLPNVIVTPHVSGLFEDRTQADVDLFVGELTRFLNGEPFLGPVDVARGY